MGYIKRSKYFCHTRIPAYDFELLVNCSTIAKKIKDVSAGLYATPSYLERLQQPITGTSLEQAEFVSFDNTGMLLKGLNKLGLNLTKANFPILTENYITHWELVKQGLVIGIMPDDIGHAEPLVERVLPDFTIEFPIWLTTHRELNTSRRVRMVFDLLAAELAV